MRLHMTACPVYFPSLHAHLQPVCSPHPALSTNAAQEEQSSCWQRIPVQAEHKPTRNEQSKALQQALTRTPSRPPGWQHRLLLPQQTFTLPNTYSSALVPSVHSETKGWEFLHPLKVSGIPVPKHSALVGSR